MATAKRGGKNRQDEQEEAGVLFIRGVPQGTIDELTAWAKELEAERGSSVSRNDLVREIVHRAVTDRRSKSKR
jgi:hypothetical protein